MLTRFAIALWLPIQVAANHGLTEPNRSTTNSTTTLPDVAELIMDSGLEPPALVIQVVDIPVGALRVTVSGWVHTLCNRHSFGERDSHLQGMWVTPANGSTNAWLDDFRVVSEPREGWIKVSQATPVPPGVHALVLRLEESRDECSGVVTFFCNTSIEFECPAASDVQVDLQDMEHMCINGTNVLVNTTGSGENKGWLGWPVPVVTVEQQGHVVFALSWVPVETSASDSGDDGSTDSGFDSGFDWAPILGPTSLPPTPPPTPPPPSPQNSTAPVSPSSTVATESTTIMSSASSVQPTPATTVSPTQQPADSIDVTYPPQSVTAGPVRTTTPAPRTTIRFTSPATTTASLEPSVNLVATFAGNLDQLSGPQQEIFKEVALTSLLLLMDGVSADDVLSTSLRSGSVIFTAAFKQSKVPLEVANAVSTTVTNDPLIVKVGAISFVSTGMEAVVPTDVPNGQSDGDSWSSTLLALLFMVPVGMLTSVTLFLVSKRCAKKDKKPQDAPPPTYARATSVVPYEFVYHPGTSTTPPSRTTEMRAPRHVMVAQGTRR